MKRATSLRVCTTFKNSGAEDVVSLVVDLLLDEDLVDHGDEDGVLLAQLDDQGGQGVHGGLPEVRTSVQAPHQRVDDSGSVL